MEAERIQKVKRLTALQKKFREDVFAASIQNTWIILKNKDSWTEEYLEFLIPTLLAQIELIPIRASKRPVEPIIISCTDDKREPHIEIQITEVDKESSPEEDIPIPTSALYNYIRAVVQLGLDPEQAIEAVIKIITPYFPENIRSEIIDNQLDRELKKIGLNTTDSSPEYKEESLFTEATASLYAELIQAEAGCSNQHTGLEENIQVSEELQYKEQKQAFKNQAEKRNEEEEFEGYYNKWEKLWLEDRTQEIEDIRRSESLEKEIYHSKLFDNSESEISLEGGEFFEEEGYLDLSKEKWSPTPSSYDPESESELDETKSGSEQGTSENYSEEPHANNEINKFFYNVPRTTVKMAHFMCTLSPPEFKPNKGKNFVSFVEDYERYRVIAEISNEDAIFHVKNSLKGDAATYFDLIWRENKNITFDDMMRKLATIFSPESGNPKVLKKLQRKLYNTKKKKGESLRKYMNKLKNQVKNVEITKDIKEVILSQLLENSPQEIFPQMKELVDRNEVSPMTYISTALSVADGMPKEKKIKKEIMGDSSGDSDSESTSEDTSSSSSESTDDEQEKKKKKKKNNKKHLSKKNNEEKSKEQNKTLQELLEQHKKMMKGSEGTQDGELDSMKKTLDELSGQFKTLTLNFMKESKKKGPPNPQGQGSSEDQSGQWQRNPGQTSNSTQQTQGYYSRGRGNRGFRGRGRGFRGGRGGYNYAQGQNFGDASYFQTESYGMAGNPRGGFHQNEGRGHNQGYYVHMSQPHPYFQEGATSNMPRSAQPMRPAGMEDSHKKNEMTKTLHHMHSNQKHPNNTNYEGTVNICSCDIAPADLQMMQREEWYKHFVTLSDPRMTFLMTVEIDGISQEGVVDSRAQLSILNKNLAWGKNIRPHMMYVNHPKDGPRRALGLCLANIKLQEGVEKVCGFLVADIDFPFILGEDLINEFGIILDYGTSKEKPAKTQNKIPQGEVQKTMQKKDEILLMKTDKTFTESKALEEFRIQMTLEEKQKIQDNDIPRDQEELIDNHILKVDKVISDQSDYFIVEMQANGHIHQVTVDTAATRSLVSADIIPRSIIKGTKVRLLAANDMSMNIVGRCQLTLSDGEQNWPQEFLVHTQKSTPLRLLVGTDFCDTYKPILDFNSNTLTISSGESISVFPRVKLEEARGSDSIFAIMGDLLQNEEDLYSSHITIYTSGKEEIKPGEDAWVKFNFYPSRPEKPSLFSPKGLCDDKIMAWECIIDKHDTTLVLTNVSEETIVVPDQTKIGFIKSDQPYLYHIQEEKMGHLIQNLIAPPEMSRANRYKSYSMDAFQMGSHLTEEEKQELHSLLSYNSDIFDEPGDPLKVSTVLKVRLPLRDTAKVIYQHNYNLSLPQHAAATKVIQQMVTEDILEPALHSNYRIPFMLVEKGIDKDTGEKQYRLVLSAKKLNESLAKVNYSPPKIPHILAQLKGKDLFSSLDLSSSFHQLAVEERDRHILTIQHEGKLYRYKKLPQGLSISSQYLCYALTLALGSNLYKIANNYVDDTIVYSKGGIKPHLAALSRIFDAFRKANFGLNRKKCKFAFEVISFLGYLVSGDRYYPDPSRFRELEKLKMAKTKKEAKRIYGYFSYYRIFLREFSKLSKPILDATDQEKPFYWGPEQPLAVLKYFRSSAIRFNIFALFRRFYLEPVFIHKSGLKAVHVWQRG
ncbi:hypothetical protein ONE63_003530 [Megalurothrips usitatus]|uniref:Reverse transcriptase domain-containing protein n=1 Tax=Megalurothrips usitatus TaxID=439358 RepID=A0AAV7XA78_9NEOP|nr:hypothetical protein ONE63_003530 [Megalurothrips usitatus]